MSALSAAINDPFAALLDRHRALLDGIDRKPPQNVDAVTVGVGYQMDPATGRRAVWHKTTEARAWGIAGRAKLRTEPRDDGQAVDLDDERSRRLFAVTTDAAPLWCMADEYELKRKGTGRTKHT